MTRRYVTLNAAGRLGAAFEAAGDVEATREAERRGYAVLGVSDDDMFGNDVILVIDPDDDDE